ncbi:BMP family ABC transporter substrate-binding protein [Halorubrum sp. GN11_10-6_MGM]|uniref:BMP family lipoprotein n=1 Tax=Halorubrum sp. GN11_10-6_MGM TaxID=2518112 RepID=UPI0010F7AA4F|nr:BMP family protein [Halorubrum sp. GN11_10-6_MGM]TKX75834.1 BMP family ABC transporter substrate-binding protein [Halorubrum sp. GN11_10-6_MGM]
MTDTRGITHSRRRFAAALGTGVAGAVAGCLGTDSSGTASIDDGSGGTTDGGDDAAVSADASATVGMVYALGGLDDRSFNDAANRGIQRARLDRDVAFTNEEPSSIADFQTTQAALSASERPDYDLICCIGFLQADALSTVAGEYPDQQYALVDSVVDRDNVASYVFREHEGSFQAGHLAGLVTARDLSVGAGSTRPDERTVGFVGGVDSSLVRKFEAGYRAGVGHAATEASVLSTYVGAFDDPEAGYAAAAEMYEAGADVVYHAAGGSGLGVFQAAQEYGRYAIGVDSDQSRSNPRYADAILASMVKRVGTAVYDAAERTIEDALRTGSTTALGLAEDGVALVYGTTLGPVIPDDVRAAIAASGERIVDGDLSVPSKPEAVGQ